MSADLLADTAARLLATHEGDPHAAMAALGWLMLPFAEADGGLMTDAGDAELLTLFSAFGRHVQVPQSLFQLVLGGTILSAASAWGQRGAFLAKLMDGSARVATALHEPEARRPLLTPQAAARRGASGWALSGTKTLAIGAPGADLVIVSASLMEEQGSPIGLYTVEKSEVAERLRPYRLRDGQEAADLTLDGLTLDEVALLLDGEAATEALQTALDRARRCLAAEAYGLIAHAVERTQRYTSERTQFGRPIGQFQVIQHRLADMASERAQGQALLHGLEAGDSSASPAATLAIVAELALSAGKSAIQLHGAMGMTEELPLGQALRRAMTLLLLL